MMTSRNDDLLHSFDEIESNSLKVDPKFAHLNSSYSVLLQENERKTVQKFHNPRLGYLFMMIAVMGVTTNHLFGKLAMFNNPKLTNYDVVFMIGVWVSIVYIPIAIYNKVELNLLKFEKGGWIALVLSVIFAIAINNVMIRGISMISLGKGTLIFWINPIFVIFLAFILLSEKVELMNVVSAIGAFIGIYFLTLNMADDNKNDSYLGIVLMIVAAMLQGWIQISVRFANLYNVPWLVRPAYIGISHFAFALMIMIWLPGTLRPWDYDLTDFILLTMSAVGAIIVIGPMNLAFRYEIASKLTPLNYVENVFTLMSDVIIFGYTFVATDYIGIFMISIWIIIPAASKIVADSSKMQK